MSSQGLDAFFETERKKAEKTREKLKEKGILSQTDVDDIEKNT